MNHDREFIKELMTKHMEGSASPVEVEMILAAMDIYDDDEIKKMLGEIDPGIDLEKYSKIRIDLPPFRVLSDRIFKNES